MVPNTTDNAETTVKGVPSMDSMPPDQRRRKILMGVAALAIVGATVATIGVDRRVAGRTARILGQLVTRARHIETITNIRLDTRKTYVLVLERRLAPAAERLAVERDIEMELEYLVRRARQFSSEPTSLPGEEQLRVQLFRAARAYSDAVDHASMSADVSPNYDLNVHLAEIDRLAAAILQLNSDTAKRDDVEVESLRRLKTKIRFGMTTFLLLSACSLLVWWLKAKAAELEIKVLHRTAELQAKNRDLHLVLDNVSQGFMTATQEGVLASDYSRAVSDWLGPVTGGMRIWEYFERVNVQFSAELKVGWEHLQDGMFSAAAVLSRLPKRLTHGHRRLRVNYQSIASTGGVMIVVSDITDQLERERVEAEQRELIQVFEAITNDHAGFVEFFNEAKTLVDLVAFGSSSHPPDEIFRAVHTLKGNASLFGLSSLAQTCHQVEEGLKNDPHLDSADRSAIQDAWKRAITKTGRFLLQSSNGIEIDDEEHRQIIAAVRTGVDRETLIHLIESWKDEPVRQRLERIADQLNKLAERQGKGHIDVVVDAAPLRLPQAKWVEFWSAFVHTVRNAVDHGIEDRDERVAAGKSPQGVVFLSLTPAAGELCLSISDDGRGIDWEAVREAALAKGVPADTREELIEAIFTDGVSTKSVVSEISGRGVGMAAVRAACQKLKGSVSLRSERGAGTRVEFRFPLTEEPASVWWQRDGQSRLEGGGQVGSPPSRNARIH